LRDRSGEGGRSFLGCIWLVFRVCLGLVLCLVAYSYQVRTHPGGEGFSTFSAVVGLIGIVVIVGFRNAAFFTGVQRWRAC